MRGALGELLAYARVAVDSGLGFAGDGARVQLPFGVHGGVMVHGAGSFSLRSEAGVYRAPPWGYGTGVFSITEAFWRLANDYALIARMTATNTVVSPSVGLAIWYP